MSPLSSNLKSDLRKALIKHFDAEELRTLSVDLGVDYDNLAGATKEAKARELIELVERQGRIDDLLAVCGRERPQVAWEAFLAANSAQDEAARDSNESSDNEGISSGSSHRARWRVSLAIIAGIAVVAALSFFLLTSPSFVAYKIDPEAAEQLADFDRLGQKIRVVAFDPNARWVILRGRNDYWISGEPPEHLYEWLETYHAEGKEIIDVSFAPNSAWLIVAGKNESRYSDSVPPPIPTKLQERLAELSRANAAIKHVAMGPQGGYFILLGSGDYEWDNMPESIGARLKSLADRKVGVRQVAMTGDGRWVVLDEKNRAWTNGVSSELSLRLWLYTVRGKPIQWVAFTPGGGWVIVTDS